MTKRTPEDMVEPPRFLAIIPEVLSPIGLIGQAIISGGAAYDAIFPVARHATANPFNYPGIPASPGDYGGLVILGGAMSANDESEHPFLRQTMDLIHAFDRADRPVLGVCLGAQIIARAYGGEVYRMDRFEAGYMNISITDAGRADPIFGELAPGFPVFQTHYEAVRGVSGAVTLATGGACPVQAFKIGSSVYGVQFHPEATIETVREWIRAFGAGFCRDEPRLLTDLDRDFTAFFPGSSEACRRLTERWMALAAGRWTKGVKNWSSGVKQLR
jgi:GMP synthase (glutamine-hydrolysing)